MTVQTLLVQTLLVIAIDAIDACPIDVCVTAIYNRYGYVKEMRDVLERWTADLTTGEFDAASTWSEPEMVRYVLVEPPQAA